MSTFILKTHKNKVKNDGMFRAQSFRQKFPLILEENTQKNQVKMASKSLRLHLPSIYQTQILLAKDNHKDIIHNKQNQYMPLKLLNRNVDHPKKGNKHNILRRLNTDAKEQQKIQRVYHNFVRKKEPRKKLQMSKIIDKVIGEAIEPWSLQRRNKWQTDMNNYQETDSCGEESIQMINKRLI